MALVASVSQCSAAIKDGLVGYWPFDETNGVVAHEASGNGLDGMLTNYPGGQGTWVAGQIGGALRFGGLSAKQYVHVPDFTKPTTSLTVSAWVWANSMPQWATIAANWNGLYGAFNYGLFGSNPYLSFYFADAGGGQGIDVANGSESPLTVPPSPDGGVPPLSLNQWYHVAIVAYDSSQMVQFYRNGQPAGSFFYSGSFYQAPVPWLNIGGEPSYGNPSQGFWDGKIDDLGLWTRALSSDEISNIYEAGLEGRSLLSSSPPPPNPPAITCSPPILLECANGGATGTAVANVQDSSGNSVEVVWLVDGTSYQTNSISPSGALISTNLTFATEFALGKHLITASASNGQTSPASCSTALTVRDTTPPIVTLIGPDTLTNECHALFTDPGAIATDTCAGSVIVITNNGVDPNSVGLYTISYTATDPSGNSTTNTRSVSVVDTTPPSIDCSTDLEVDAQSPAGALVNFSVTATDGCDPFPQVVCGPASGSLFLIGQTLVTCTATDASSNSTNCTFLIKVRSAADMLTNLVLLAEGLPIQHGVKNSLLVKLNNGSSNLAKGNQPVTLNLVAAFENEVEAQRGEGLSSAQADALLTSANAVSMALAGSVSETMASETTYSGQVFAQLRATSGIDGSGRILMISWAGNGVLQSADAPNGDWTDVPLAVSPYWAEVNAPGQFFRVRPQ